MLDGDLVDGTGFDRQKVIKGGITDCCLVIGSINMVGVWVTWLCRSMRIQDH